MNSLPLETLQRIFELACTDGGFTGNALSATSKEIRAVARRSRFQTLRIAADSDRFEDFVAFYKRECDNGNDDRPPVRHLFLQLTTRSPYEGLWMQADMTPPPTMCMVIVSSGPVVPRKRSPCASIFKVGARLVKQLTARMSRKSTSCRVDDALQAMPVGDSIWHQPYHDTPDESCERAIQELLRLVAPDLWSLVIYEGAERSPRHLLRILRGPFPLLREAAFIGFPEPSRLCQSDYRKLSPMFPVATHLHLLPNYGGVACDQWSRLAPRVSHLRVSRICHGHSVEELAAAVGVAVTMEYIPPVYYGTPPPPPPPPPPPGPPTYPSVRYLLMEPSYAPNPGFACCHVCGNFGSRANAEVIRGLRSIARKCRERIEDQIAAIALPMSATPKNCTDVLVRQWLERVEGGEGWWEEHDPAESELVDSDTGSVDDDEAESLE